MAATDILPEIINNDIFSRYTADDFLSIKPFPWINYKNFLSNDFFNELHATYPSIEHFEQHEGIPRIYGQRPHNRYYLAFQDSLYEKVKQGRVGEKKPITYDELAPAWQVFIDYLNSDEYREFLARMFNVSRFTVRFAWHIQKKGWEVSPHIDSTRKIGSHLFYFNTTQDWQDAWGGNTMVLKNKQTTSKNPGFNDFAGFEKSEIMDNRSFLFKNNDQAWHGMKALTSPEDKFRKIFTVVINYPEPGKIIKMIKAPVKKLRDVFA